MFPNLQRINQQREEDEYGFEVIRADRRRSYDDFVLLYTVRRALPSTAAGRQVLIPCVRIPT